MSKFDAKSGSPRRGVPKPAGAVHSSSDIGSPAGGGVAIQDTIRLEYAGKYVAWAPDGHRIVAVASTFEAAERKAAKAGYSRVAIDKIPKGRTLR
jgi:hypothetical protein